MATAKRRLALSLAICALAVAVVFASIAPTAETTGNSNTAGTSFATASITPDAGDVYFAAIGSGGTETNPPTASGNGLTWHQVNTTIYNSNSDRTTLFCASGTPSAGAITFDFGAQSQSNVIWNVVEFSGADVSAQCDTTTVVQSVSAHAAGASDLSASVPLAAFSNAGNGTFGVAFDHANRAFTAHLTEISQGSGTPTFWHSDSQYDAGNQTTVAWDIASTGAWWGAVAVEVKVPGGGASAPAPHTLCSFFGIGCHLAGAPHGLRMKVLDAR